MTGNIAEDKSSAAFSGKSSALAVSHVFDQHLLLSLPKFPLPTATSLPAHVSWREGSITHVPGAKDLAI